MRILLLGEYSNVHATLREGLTTLGHTVTLASNGDFWKDYPRDIDLSRGSSRLSGLTLYAKILSLLPRFTNYDIAQLINPLCFEIQAQRHMPIIRYLLQHNRRLVLGAFGMDYYYVHENITRRPLRYSDFNLGDTLRSETFTQTFISDWIGTPKETLNRFCADHAHAIVTGLYEYDVCYRPNFPTKTTFIPLPIKVSTNTVRPIQDKVNIFIGISKNRSQYKGTDIMLSAAQDIARQYPARVNLIIAEGIPFNDYCHLLQQADIILDQLYSYTPAMNALQAMSQGIVCVGGGEPENYDILHDDTLRPIINVEPNYHSVFLALQHIIHHPDELLQRKHDSLAYISRHHNHLHIARQYLHLYQQLLDSTP